ncbi:MAG: hypothetical protein AAF004_08825 [Pseudomonadota bacterium]
MNRMIPGFIVAVALAGCGQQPGSSNVVVAATPAPTKAEIDATHMHGDSIGKPTLPITFAYDYTTPTVGEPMTVSVSVDSADISAMSMRVSTRGDIAVSKSTPDAIPMKANGIDAASETLDIVVTPSAEGRSYLNVIVSGTYEGQPVTKAVSIPIQIGQGGPTLKSNGTIIETDVEVLSSMPASQTVKSGTDPE